MNAIKLFSLICASLILTLALPACSQSSKSEISPAKKSGSSSLGGAFGGDGDKENRHSLAQDSKDEEKKEDRLDDKNLGPVFFSGDPGNVGRLLEITGDLSYQVTNFQLARTFILNWTGKYGFLSQSQVYGGESPSLRATLHIRSDKLLEAFAELDALGKLQSESFQTTDHTEGMMLQTLKKKREDKRQARRQIDSGNLAAGEKNWQSVENALSASEDQSDAAEFEKWKILDRVKWAKLSLSIYLPEPSDKIVLPEYGKAFKAMVSGLLKLSYFLLVALPFLLILGLAAYGIYRLARKLDSNSTK